MLLVERHLVDEVLSTEFIVDSTFRRTIILLFSSFAHGQGTVQFSLIILMAFHFWLQRKSNNQNMWFLLYCLYVVALATMCIFVIILK